MANPIECIRFKAKNRKVDDERVQELEELVERLRQQDAGLSEIQLAEKALGIVEFRLKQRRSWAARQTAIIQSVTDRAALGGDDVDKTFRALRSVFANDPAREFSHLPSFESVALTETNRGVKIMFEALKGARAKMLGFSQDTRAPELMLREVRGENTGDATAKAWADAWREMDEYFVRRRQYFGSPVVKREGWFPQQHDPKKIARVPKEEWVNFTYKRLSRKDIIDVETGAPMTDDQLQQVLGDIYDNSLTNGASKIQPGRGRSTYGYATRAEESRFLHFESTEAFLEYDRRFGSGGDIFSLMVGHMEHMGREIATLKLLGPDPPKTVQVMKDLLRQTGADENLVRQIDWAHDSATGRLNIPLNANFAAAGQATRNILTGTLLGKAVLTAVPGDLATTRLAAQFNGLPTWRAWTQIFKHAVSQLKGDKDQMAELGANLLLGAESYMHTALGMQRFLGEFEGPRATRMFADVMLRATGLTPWTQASRQGFSTMFLGQLASHAKRFDFEQLARDKPRLHETLQSYGITAEDWAKLRDSRFHRQHGGGSYLDTDLIFREGEEDLGQRVMQMILTERDRGIIASTVRSRMAVVRGNRPGGITEELMRALTMFWQFPVGFYQQIYQSTFRNPAFSSGRKATTIADAVISMTIAGAIAQQANELIRGRDPDPRMWDIDPDDPDSFKRAGAFWSSAMVRGGAAPIVGDYLSRDLGAWGTFGMQVVGPVGGAAVDIAGLTISPLHDLLSGDETTVLKDLASAGRKYTPLMNSWMAGLAADRLIWDRLQQHVDPDAYSRFNRGMRERMRERGQMDWWAPGETEPSRAPQLGSQ